jgi:hypothetical protein
MGWKVMEMPHDREVEGRASLDVLVLRMGYLTEII